MSGSSAIEWTDATPVIDRDGRRIRLYCRLRTDRPGQQMRRRMAAFGLRWCRRCGAWRADVVGKNGLCVAHAREEYRTFYAANRERVCASKVARKRGIAPVPAIGAQCLTERFAGLCAYCGEGPATTWDHIVPVSQGGLTEPGNVVPACVSCNSSKRDRDVVEWARERGLDLGGVGDVTALVAA